MYMQVTWTSYLATLAAAEDHTANAISEALVIGRDAVDDLLPEVGRQTGELGAEAGYRDGWARRLCGSPA
jgi:hypothetical protein